MLLQQVAELSHSLRAILLAHALSASTNANLDHTALDGVGDVDACLKAARALPVERLHGGGNGEAGGESGSAEFSCATARSKDGADSDVFDERRVDAGTLDERFEGTMEEVSGCGVFETTFASFGDGSAERSGDDNLITIISVCSVARI